jgi:hypothetical protein
MAGEHAGPSILEMLWDQLEFEYRELLGMPGQVFDATINKQRGVCQGLCTAIAIMTNPYDPDEDAVRREIVERAS